VDDTEVNCDTARELGMTTVHFRETEQALDEIAAALEGGPPVPA
jgi:FMN phosphatase YigB (HAD superfamily)